MSLDPDTLSVQVRGGGARIRNVALDDGFVCFDTETRQVLVTNEVGLAMWRGLTSDLSRRQVVDEVESWFAAPRERIVADLDAFVERLRVDADGRPESTERAFPPIVDPVPDRPPSLTCRRRWAFAGGAVVIESESREVVTGLERLLGRSFADVPFEEELPDDTPVIRVRKEGDRYPITCWGSTIDTGLNSTDATARLSRVGASAFAGREGWIAALHAAAIERDGKAILFPAASGSGKTHVVAHNFLTLGVVAIIVAIHTMGTTEEHELGQRRTRHDRSGQCAAEQARGEPRRGVRREPHRLHSRRLPRLGRGARRLPLLRSRGHRLLEVSFRPACADPPT